MADWFNITDSMVDPDAPLTSELAYAWRDNSVAIAEGAVGAPRVVSVANAPPVVFSGGFTGTSYIAFTGLGLAASILASARVGQSETGASTSFYAGFSSNGGSTYGADQKLADMSAGQGLILDSYINLITGAVVSSGVNISASSASGDPGLTSSVTVPAGVNAVRFRSSAVVRNGTVAVRVTGGRP